MKTKTTPTLPATTRRMLKAREMQSLTSRSFEQTNPLRNLSLARAVAMFEADLRGEYALSQWTLWHIEQTDADLFALIARRTAALVEMDWNIKTVSEAKDVSLAEQQAEVLRAAYEKIDNFSEVVEEMAAAFCRGFAIFQVERGEEGGLHFGAYKPWNIARDGLAGDFYFNPDARQISTSALSEDFLLDRNSHIIYQVPRNIRRLALIKFIRSNLSQKDWDAFIEIYGLPSAFVIMPPNIPAEREAEYEAAALSAADGGSGALPNGSDVRFASEPRGINPFRDHLQYLQQQLILAGTGGLLTMLSQPTGIGSGTSDAHEDTFKTIARGEARKISECLQKQFDRRVLNNYFPGRPPLAYFELAAREEQDIGEIIDHALKLTQAGYRIDVSELSEKTGYKISSVSISSGGAPFGNLLPNRAAASAGLIANSSAPDAGDDVTAAVRATLGAWQTQLEPVVKMIESELAGKNLAPEAALDVAQRIVEEMPALIDEPAAATEKLEEIMAQALIGAIAQTQGAK